MLNNKSYPVQGWEALINSNNKELAIQFIIKDLNGTSEDSKLEFISFNKELAQCLINTLTNYINKPLEDAN